jgi:hypothetical protein
MNYKYRTHDDNITGEVYSYFDFEELATYLEIYCDKLNVENKQTTENYIYGCKTEEDAKKICEACNIDLVIIMNEK